MFVLPAWEAGAGLWAGSVRLGGCPGRKRSSAGMPPACPGSVERSPPPSGMLARRLLLLALATTASALRLHRVSSRGASLLARRETLALGLASGLAVSVQSASADAPPTAAAPPTRSIRESIEALRAAPPSDSGQPLPSRSLVTRRYFTRETADVEYPSWFQGSWKCTSTLEQARPDPLPPRSPSTLTLTLSLTLTSAPTCRCSRPAEPRSSPRVATAPRRCMPQGGSNPGPAASSQPHLFPPTPLSHAPCASPHLTSPTSPLASPHQAARAPRGGPAPRVPHALAPEHHARGQLGRRPRLQHAGHLRGLHGPEGRAELRDQRRRPGRARAQAVDPSPALI